MPEIDYTSSHEAVDWVALARTLADDDFDNGRTPKQLEQSFRNSRTAIYARDGERVIGKGRALSDGVCNAYIVDVWTCSAYRRRGIGTRILELLCESLSGQHVYLFTDDMSEFYAKNGFVARGTGLQRLVGHWLNTPER